MNQGSSVQLADSLAHVWTVGLLVGSAEDKYENALLRGISDVLRTAGVNLICFTSGALRSLHGFEAQRNVLYDLVNADKPRGWHNQIHGEPGLLIAYLEKWRYGPATGVQAVPHAERKASASHRDFPYGRLPSGLAVATRSGRDK